MARPDRRVWWNAAGVLLGLALLVWTFWSVDARGLYEVLSRSAPGYVALVGVGTFVIMFAKAWRWHIVITAAEKVTLRLVALATLIGFLANAVLPARAGEVVRVVLLGQRARVSKTTLLASMGVDKLLEGASMVAVLAALPLFSPTPLWFRSAAWIMGGLLAALLVAGAVIGSSREHPWLDRLPLSARWRERLATFFAKLSSGFAALRSPAHLFGALTVAIGIWVLQAFVVWICLRSVHLELSMLDAFVVLMAVNLGGMAPAAPGSVGTFEFSAVVALGFLGVDKTSALAFALVYHMVQLIPTVIVGVAALPLMGIRFRELRQPAEGGVGDGAPQRAG